MKYPPAMPEFRPSNDAPLPDAAALCHGIRDGMLVGLMLITLAPAGEAKAGDQEPITAAASDLSRGVLRQPLQPPAMMAAPADFTAPAIRDSRSFSATDFRPRRHTVFDSDPTVSALDDAPLFRSTTVWQRLAEYKSHDRVQLLTLWESSGSSVSLQAGRRGDPSLQWTSRLMNRGGSTQGLLDRLFSVSLAHAGSGLRRVSQSMGQPAAAKQADAPAAAGLK